MTKQAKVNKQKEAGSGRMVVRSFRREEKEKNVYPRLGYCHISLPRFVATIRCHDLSPRFVVAILVSPFCCCQKL